MQRSSFRHVHESCGCRKTAQPAPRSERKYERSRPFETTHLFLDLRLDLERKSVSGTARLDFRRRDPKATTFDLDAHAFTLDGLTLELGGRERALEADVDYHYDGEKISVDVPEGTERATLSVRYSAKPSVGLYFLAPDAAVPDRPRQVWSQCQDEDGHHWFPCQDKPHVKMTSEIRVEVPPGMQALSNGHLVARETPKKGPHRYHYRHLEPHPAYLVTLVVGDFDEWSETVTLPSGRAVPLRFLVPKGKLADGRRAFEGTARMVRLLSEKFGVEYPWESYAQVVVSDFIFGGMENTTATTMYEHILLDERASLDIESHDLVAHELAHQWFGDFVTCRDWSHAWLNEGFATFCELVERESRLGRDEYDFAVLGDLDAYLAEARGDYMRPIVSRQYDEPIDLFDRHLYQKGGLVLHMLRRKLGDEAFFGGVSNYLRRHGKGLVETTDLVRALEETSGRSLERFFDEWVHRPGHPELVAKISREKQRCFVELKQTHEGPEPRTFELEIDVAWTDDGGEKRTTTVLDEGQTTVAFDFVGKLSSVTIDPELRLAIPLEVEAPSELLALTLEKAPSLRGKLSAAEALAKKHDARSVDALARCLGRESAPWMVRAEAASGLGKTPNDEARAALLAAATTDAPKVRRAAVRALGEFRGEDVEKVLGTLAKKDPSYLVRGEAARSLGKTRAPSAPKTLTPLLGTPSWADVVTAGALDGLASGLELEPSVEKSLVEWTKYGRPLRARRAAIAALGRVGEGRFVREHLLELLRDRDPHLRTQVLGALGALGDPRARPAIARFVEGELDGRVRKTAKGVLAKLGTEKNSGLRATNEQLQKLEKELAGLRARLSRLEAPTASTRGVSSERATPKAKGRPAPRPSAKRAAKKPGATGKKTAKKR